MIMVIELENWVHVWGWVFTNLNILLQITAEGVATPTDKAWGVSVCTGAECAGRNV